jgi:hypothetical protein
MCLNFVQGGTCHVTGRECLLRSYDSLSRCELQGDFDVWITQEDDILLSDMGPPSGEPKRAIALGVKGELAQEIAMKTAKETGGRLRTTQHKCGSCGGTYWITDHDDVSGVAKIGRGYFCPFCIEEVDEREARSFGAPDSWCG